MLEIKNTVKKAIFIFFLLYSSLLFGVVPTVTSTALISVDEANNYNYTLGATDADGDVLTWSVKSGTTLPSWLSLNTLPT